MNCMTYDYRFSMLIHTEFEYRSRYLKKTTAIPDIHYEIPLNSDIRAVLELEAKFNSEMETSLDKGTQRKTTENELPSLTQCTA